MKHPLGTWKTFAWMIGLWQLSAFAFAHPFHTTTAEMEFNAESGRFEVSLKMPASDFEHMVKAGTAIARELKKSATSAKDFDATKISSDEHVKHYLEQHFALSVAGKACRLEWVGSEDDQLNKWLYFELIPESENTSGTISLTNKVLCDLNKGQINTVVFLSKTTRVSLKTHAQEPTAVVPHHRD